MIQWYNLYRSCKGITWHFPDLSHLYWSVAGSWNSSFWHHHLGSTMFKWNLIKFAFKSNGQAARVVIWRYLKFGMINADGVLQCRLGSAALVCMWPRMVCMLWAWKAWSKAPSTRSCWRMQQIEMWQKTWTRWGWRRFFVACTLVNDTFKLNCIDFCVFKYEFTTMRKPLTYTFFFDFDAVWGQSPLATWNNEFMLACSHRKGWHSTHRRP